MAATFLYEVTVVEVLLLTPSAGPPAGGTAVVLLGRGFVAGATVTFDGVPATSVAVVSAERLTCTTPAHAIGAVDVTVTNVDASTGTLADGFTYESVAGAVAVRSRTRLTNGPLRISQTLGQESTYTFTAAEEPTGEQQVEVRVFGVSLFLGTVTRIVERIEGVEHLRVWDTEATDLSHWLTRHHPVGTWTDVSASTVLADLLATAPGFSAAGVEAGLPHVTIVLDGSADLWASVVEVCTRSGTKCFLDGTTLYAFLLDSGFDPPGDVTATNPDLLWPSSGQAVTVDWDYKSLANRVTVRGALDLTVTLENAASIALYGTIALPTINDPTLTTLVELTARAQAVLDQRAWPIQTAHYATRDLKTRAGKTVTITMATPLISGAFLIETVQIDELELANGPVPTRPRFVVTAKPASAPMASRDNLIPILKGLTQQQAKTPTIPDNSIPAAKLQGCIPSEKLTQTGVAPGTYGGDTSYAIDVAGRVTAATPDASASVKADGSAPFTADQPMGGHSLSGLRDPVAPTEPVTLSYLEGHGTLGPPGVDGRDGDDAWPVIVSGGGGGVGPTGPQGAAGAAGMPGVPGRDGEDGDGWWPVIVPAAGGTGTGPTGPAGADGAPGPVGPSVPGIDGRDGDDAWPIITTPSASSAPSGALVLLEQHTAAASASLDFTTAITSLYDEYWFELVNLVPTTDNVLLWMRMSTDGGATYVATGSYTYDQWNWRAGGSGLGGGSALTKIILTIDAAPMTNAAARGVSGHLRLFSPLSSSLYKEVNGRTHWVSQALLRGATEFIGAFESTTPVNAVQFLMSSGNIASGTIRVYGIAK